MNVAVVGASPNPDRYSYRAVHALVRAGHRVFPVNPKYTEIDGLKVYRSLQEISSPIDTVSLYVSSRSNATMGEQLLDIQPRRVVFNPGAENEQLENLLRQHGIEIVEACTLSLVSMGLF